MKYLFTDKGMATLEAFCFSSSLFAFDYDGTLSPIVKDPSMAFMGNKTGKLLQRLCELRTVAVISGRSLSDVKSKLTITPAYVIGNHGLEGLKSFKISYDKAEASCNAWRRILESSLGSFQGIYIEDKKYSLAVHYRNSRRKIEAKKEILNEISKLKPFPRIILGKSVINLVPVGAPHKGIALMELMMENSKTSAVYVGDDYTDEDIFTLPEERIMKIKVGKKQDSNADFYLKRQSEINRVLEKIIKFCGS